MHHRILAIIVLSSVIGTPQVFAQKMHLKADVETTHLWRGQEVSDGLTISAEAGISDRHDYFRLGMWGASQTDGSYKEADWYVNYNSGTGLNIALWDIYNFSPGIAPDGSDWYKYGNYNCRTTGHFLDSRFSFDFGVRCGFPLRLFWGTILAGRDRGKEDKQNIYSSYVEAAYTVYENQMFKLDTSVGGTLALNNYSANSGANFYGNSAGVNDIRIACTYKLNVGKHPMPITAQTMWNPERNKIYFCASINLLDI